MFNGKQRSLTGAVTRITAFKQYSGSMLIPPTGRLTFHEVGRFQDRCPGGLPAVAGGGVRLD